ncbi:MAG: hypothetical protein ABSE06_12545 [Anaerolineaceae bacterium]
MGIIALVTRLVNAGPFPAGADHPVQSIAGPTDNAASLSCHSTAGKTVQFATGEAIPRTAGW